MIERMPGRPVSPLIGREAELAALAEAVDAIVARDPAATRSQLLIAGEAGIGKTRLVDELSRLAEGRGVLVLRGAATDLGDGDVPYGAIVEALRPLPARLGPDVLAEVVAYFPYLPTPMRLAFPVGLRLLEIGPPLVLRRMARFSRLPPDDARAYLERLHAMGGPFAALVLGLRTLVLMNFYQHPQVLAALEIDWAGRAKALTERRAALLEGTP